MWVQAPFALGSVLMGVQSILSKSTSVFAPPTDMPISYELKESCKGVKSRFRKREQVSLSMMFLNIYELIKFKQASSLTKW